MKKLSNSLGWDITSWQYNNVWPIVVTVFLLALSYSAWTTRIAVLEEKIDNLTETVKTYERGQKDVITDLNNLHSRVVANETKLDNLIR